MIKCKYMTEIILYTIYFASILQILWILMQFFYYIYVFTAFFSRIISCFRFLFTSKNKLKRTVYNDVDLEEKVPHINKHLLTGTSLPFADYPSNTDLYQVTVDKNKH